MGSSLTTADERHIEQSLSTIIRLTTLIRVCYTIFINHSMVKLRVHSKLDTKLLRILFISYLSFLEFVR
jgi:hypothetical protein